MFVFVRRQRWPGSRRCIRYLSQLGVRLRDDHQGSGPIFETRERDGHRQILLQSCQSRVGPTLRRQERGADCDVRRDPPPRRSVVVFTPASDQRLRVGRDQEQPHITILARGVARNRIGWGSALRSSEASTDPECEDAHEQDGTAERNDVPKRDGLVGDHSGETRSRLRRSRLKKDRRIATSGRKSVRTQLSGL
jgi:hypothetical protein